MLKKLSDERAEKLTFIEGLTSQASEGERDLTDNDLELITRAKERIGAIDKQLTVLSGDLELNEQAKEAIARLSGAVQGGKPADAVEYRTAGAYVHDLLNMRAGQGNQRAEAEDRLRRYHRAVSHITTGEFAGIWPQEIVGPLINFINSTRPLVTSLGVIGVPSGPSFRRPRLVDPNIATGAGVQAAEKDELQSQPFQITSDNVDLSTVGGYANVARQVIDFGVASMDTIVNQLAARYSYATERLALTELQKSTGKVTLAAGAAGDVLIKAIYDAAALVFNTTGQLPTTLAAGPAGWSRLGSIVDAAGRQLFPFLAPGNAAGQQSAASFAGNPVGLGLVVTPAMTDDTFWVLNAACMEVYEQTLPPLTVTEPSVVGIQVAVAGYCGFYRPAPNGAVHLAP